MKGLNSVSMSKKQFSVTTTLRDALPRSKRRHNTSQHGVSGTINFVSAGGPNGDGHVHNNKMVLDAQSMDDDGYLYLRRRTDNAEESVTEKIKAGYADLAGGIPEDVLKSLPYLSKLADDVAKGNITFEQMISVLGLSVFGGGAQFGKFVSSMNTGTGAAIDELGNGEFESVKVRTFFECLEIIINRLSTIEGDQLLTEADTVEHFDIIGTRRYRLHLKRKWEGYITSQKENNVLKGVINTFAKGQGSYRTCWLRVDVVNTSNNYIDCTLYDDEDVPAGVNQPPVELMVVARWGNQSDAKRQSCIYMSSTEGRIVHLTNVTSPKITAANYGATFGALPDFLKAMNLPVIEGQDYLYARGIVVQDIIRVDYQGKPKAEIIDRGQWVSGGSYYAADLNPTTGTYETSDVWHYGCRYRCAKTGTTVEPAYGVTDWAMVEGNPELMVGFKEDVIFCDPANFNAKLSVVVKAYNQDITDTIADSDVSWSRYSESAEGEPRQFEDALWGHSRANAGKILTLSLNDLSYEAASPPRVVRFIVTVNK